MVRFAIAPNLVLPVYVLNDPSDQREGFRRFGEIPTAYGLFFPEVRGTSFHMHTVGAPLLACGLESIDRSNVRVVSAALWLPEGSCPYRGEHVLECNPCYSSFLKEGTVIHLAEQSKKDLRLF